MRAHRPCPTCSGTGRVPSIESVGLNLLRRIEARAATGRLMKARIELHSELAEAIQNGRRRDFVRLEEEFGIEIEIVSSHRLLGPEEQIEWRDRPTPLAVTPMRPVEPVSRRQSRRRRRWSSRSPPTTRPRPRRSRATAAASASAAGAAAASARGARTRRPRTGAPPEPT